MLLLSQNLGYFARLKALFSKFLPLTLKSIKEYWHTHSGDWHWIQEKPKPIASLNRSLWQLSVPSFSFCFMLALSSIIGTLGLLGNSVAVIIGAMIIAPLMGPIIGIAYSMVVSNRRLLRRSSLTLLIGILLTIVTAYITTSLVGLSSVSSEILIRTNPTLIDLGIAMAAGAAGAFANSRRRIADAIPGVAIAVALVPPLSVVGIGLAFQQERLAIGAMLLFLTNLVGIVFSGSIVFLSQSYGNIKKAKHGLLFTVLFVGALGLPLTFSLRDLLIKQNVSRNVEELIRNQTVTFSRRNIRTINVSRRADFLLVDLEVFAPLNSISQTQINLVRDFLQKELAQPVELRVQIIPIEVLDAPAVSQ